MAFENRLQILRQANMLSEQNEQIIKDTICYFAEEEGVLLTEENAAGFITHLCAALSRMDQGNSTEPIEESLLENLKEAACYERAYLATERWAVRYPQITEAEKSYLLLHICAIYHT